MTELCRNPQCESDDPPTSWLDPWFCSDKCREAWCRANGRNTAGELLGPVPPAGPPIVHPAGEIPEYVERRASADLARKAAAMNLVNATWGASDAVGVPPSSAWRVDQGFLARLRKRWIG